MCLVKNMHIGKPLCDFNFSKIYYLLFWRNSLKGYLENNINLKLTKFAVLCVFKKVYILELLAFTFLKKKEQKLISFFQISL